MTQASRPGQRLAAPRENRAMLAMPAMEAAGSLAADNRSLQGRSNCLIQGRPLAELSRQARAELLQAARDWTGRYRNIGLPALDPSGPIFLAGHQPELFHPGVWFKNFALSAMARQHGAAAVNLVIDSDTLKGVSLATPGGSLDDPRRETVPFDRPEVQLPFEERTILDAGRFAGFGRRVAERIRPLVPNPIIEQFWPMVLERARQENRLGYCLAQARHQLEGQWGADTLEVPQSAVCDSESFRWFLAHLLANLDRFHSCYNRAVQEYRRANRIRNAAHPAPDLAVDGPWLEAPLWLWTAAQPQRRRVFVRRRGREIVISDRAGNERTLPLTPDGDGHESVGRLKAWAQEGVKIRSRALITTLWARLALGDLFVHGIGGAKYDQVTDRLIETFFGIAPPGIMVLSATLYLPIPRPHDGAERLREIGRQLREISYHPEKFLDESASAGPPSPAGAALAEEKRRWIRAETVGGNGRARWKAIRDINDRLQPWVAGRRQQLLETEYQARRALWSEKALGSREYGFCLFPETYLREFLSALLPKRP